MVPRNTKWESVGVGECMWMCTCETGCVCVCDWDRHTHSEDEGSYKERKQLYGMLISCLKCLISLSLSLSLIASFYLPLTLTWSHTRTPTHTHTHSHTRTHCLVSFSKVFYFENPHLDQLMVERILIWFYYESTFQPLGSEMTERNFWFSCWRLERVFFSPTNAGFLKKLCHCWAKQLYSVQCAVC